MVTSSDFQELQWSIIDLTIELLFTVISSAYGLHSLTITQEIALTFYENFSFMYSHSLRNVMLKSKFYLKNFLFPSRNFEGHWKLKNTLHGPYTGHNHAFVLIVFVSKQQVREYTSWCVYKALCELPVPLLMSRSTLLKDVFLKR